VNRSKKPEPKKGERKKGGRLEERRTKCYKVGTKGADSYRDENRNHGKKKKQNIVRKEGEVGECSGRHKKNEKKS